MQNLTDDQFKENIENGITVIDVWATWCGPCRMLGPIFENVSKNFEGDDSVSFYKANVDETPELAKEFGVTSVPTILFIKDGELVDTLVGVIPQQVIIDKVDAIK